jgi:hypothetical protein
MTAMDVSGVCGDGFQTTVFPETSGDLVLALTKHCRRSGDQVSAGIRRLRLPYPSLGLCMHSLRFALR